MTLQSLLRRAGVFLAVCAAFIIAGCGGGGGGGALGSLVGLFFTDDLNTGYDAVWVNVKKVELLGESGPTVLFDSAAGHVTNVRALSSGGQGRFLFLGEDHVPAGTYTGFRLTLGKDVVLYPTGSSTGLAREFAGLDANSNKVLEVQFAAPKQLGAEGSHLVLDFKLDQWSDDGALIQGATVVEGSPAGLDDPSRHDEDHYKGTVSGLSGDAPNFSFTLNGEHGMQLLVKADANTSVFNGDGSANPALANGKRVQVNGAFSPADGAVLALSIMIKNGESHEGHEVSGDTSELNADAGTFQVKVRDAEGFLPENGFVTVHIDAANTRLRSHGGLPLTPAEFFALLAAHPGIGVEAEGTLSADQPPVFEASAVKIASGDDFGEVEASGKVLSTSPADGTFQFELKEWEGFAGSLNAHVNVATNGDTVYKNSDGAAMTKDAFFAALAVGAKVEMKGSYEAGTITALRLKLDDAPAGDAEAKGSVLSVDAGLFKLDMALSEWHRMSASSGQTVHVQAGDSTTFRNASGETIAKADFFALAQAGSTVVAVGAYDSGSSTLNAARMRLAD